MGVRRQSRHHGSTAALVRARIENGGERFWKLEDFPERSSSAVLTALSRLAREGELQRVQKGVYFRPRSIRSPPGPGAAAAAAATLRAPVHPAGLTAAYALGLSAHNPLRREFATPAAGKPRALGDAVVYTGRPDSRVGLSSIEGALLEFLRGRGESSELSPRETVMRLRRLFADERRFGRLAKAAREEPPRVRAMLGALGQELDADPGLLKRLRQSLNRTSRFDFGVLRELRNAAEWQAK